MRVPVWRFGMLAGAVSVMAGLILGVHGHLVGDLAGRSLGLQLTLFGVILCSLATALLAYQLMKLVEPPFRKPFRWPRMARSPRETDESAMG